MKALSYPGARRALKRLRKRGRRRTVYVSVYEWFKGWHREPVQKVARGGA